MATAEGSGRVIGPDLRGASGFGHQLDLAGTLHTDEPPGRFVNRPARGEDAMAGLYRHEMLPERRRELCCGGPIQCNPGLADDDLLAIEDGPSPA